MPRISALLTRVAWGISAVLMLSTVPAGAQSPPTLPTGRADSPEFRARLEAAALDYANQPWQREFMLQLAVSLPPGRLAPVRATASLDNEPMSSRWSASSTSVLNGIWNGPLPTERFFSGAIYDPVRDRMVVFGGQGGDGDLNDVWAMPLSGAPNWTALAPAGTSPSARSRHSAIYDPVRDRIVVFGGQGGSGLLSDTWALSLGAAPVWTELTPTGTPPSARDGHSAIYDSVRDRMVVFGGNSAGGALNDLWELSLGGVPAWTELTPTGTPPIARHTHSAIYDSVRDRMVVFGGSSVGGDLNDARALSLAGTPAWTALTPTGTPPFARYGNSAIYDAARERILVFGGSSGDPYNGVGYFHDVWALSLGGTPAWTELTPTGTPPIARSSHSAIYDPVRDRMMVFGGRYDGLFDPIFLADAWALSLGGTPAWTELTPTGPPPSARFGHTAIYDPVRDRMVVFGGYNYSRFTTEGLGDVWALSLADTPTWTELTPTGTPPIRRGSHSAIYDPVRDRMVVFGGAAGGYGGSSLVNDVWAMSLGGAPAWTELTPTGPPPSARSGHTAIYDPVRDRMVVFGGGSDSSGWSQYSNEVWALSLGETPSWTPLMPSGTPPSGRHGHSSIYDPIRDRMVVLGGSSGWSEIYNEVWALSLWEPQAWTELTPTGTPPTARSSHSAIYDPMRDRMVVFGGVPFGVNLNDAWAMSLGGAPAWTELTPTGTPPIRRGSHSAVYDPIRDRMVVFAGSRDTPSVGMLLNDVRALEWSGPGPPSPTITATAGPGGTISPGGTTTVPYGNDQVFTITSDACYSIADVQVDGVSVGVRSSYTFSGVMVDHTIAASFTISTYWITPSANTGGSISPGATTRVDCGGSQTFAITPETCYSVADVLVDGSSILGVSNYTFSNVTADHTIAAEFSFKGSTLDDLDGDGLLDEWETLGIPIDGGGRYLLPNADPQHKDLYLELDAMTGQAPTQAELQNVVNAFAESPVCNPDATSGIALHIIGGGGCDPCVDESDLPAQAWGEYYDPNASFWDTKIHPLKGQHFGPAAEHDGSPQWGLIAAARARAVRYCLFGVSFTVNGTYTSGVREPSGNDFVVTLGGGSFDPVTPEKRTGTLMHELGHSLGLGHGGTDGTTQDGVNFKPNYVSVMNYLWQWPAPEKINIPGARARELYRGSWRLDYSRVPLRALDEGHLNEYAGIGGDDHNRFVPIGSCPSFAAQPRRISLACIAGPVDWNGDGQISAGNVERDVTSFGLDPSHWGSCDGTQALAPRDDWSHLRYAPTEPFSQSTAARLLAIGETEVVDELTAEVYDALGTLRFDCNGNDVPDDEEIADGTLPDVNNNGIPDLCETPALLVAIGETLARPLDLSLAFVPQGAGHEIRYSLPVRAPTTLRIFDVSGRVVVTLAGGDAPVGAHRIVWGHVDASGRAVSSGVYFVELVSGARRAVGKIVILR